MGVSTRAQQPTEMDTKQLIADLSTDLFNRMAAMEQHLKEYIETTVMVHIDNSIKTELTDTTKLITDQMFKLCTVIPPSQTATSSTQTLNMNEQSKQPDEQLDHNNQQETSDNVIKNTDSITPEETHTDTPSEKIDNPPSAHTEVTFHKLEAAKQHDKKIIHGDKPPRHDVFINGTPPNTSVETIETFMKNIGVSNVLNISRVTQDDANVSCFRVGISDTTIKHNVYNTDNYDDDITVMPYHIYLRNKQQHKSNSRTAVNKRDSRRPDPPRDPHRSTNIKSQGRDPVQTTRDFHTRKRSVTVHDDTHRSCKPQRNPYDHHTNPPTYHRANSAELCRSDVCYNNGNVQSRNSYDTGYTWARDEYPAYPQPRREPMYNHQEHPYGRHAPAVTPYQYDWNIISQPARIQPQREHHNIPFVPNVEFTVPPPSFHNRNVGFTTTYGPQQ